MNPITAFLSLPVPVRMFCVIFLALLAHNAVMACLVVFEPSLKRPSWRKKGKRA